MKRSDEPVGMIEALESGLSAGAESAAVDRMELVAVDLDGPLADPSDAQPATSGAEIAHGQDETLRPARRVDGQVRGMEKVAQCPSRGHAHRSPRGGADGEPRNRLRLTLTSRSIRPTRNASSVTRRAIRRHTLAGGGSRCSPA